MTSVTSLSPHRLHEASTALVLAHNRNRHKLNTRQVCAGCQYAPPDGDIIQERIDAGEGREDDKRSSGLQKCSICTGNPGRQKHVKHDVDTVDFVYR
ncbi:hypothetical protein LSAT2_025024 [Lamellibrachia satsuma]|nr:hypothetical protein LSAT2_025024 [Lamellibrachia satsuma]